MTNQPHKPDWFDGRLANYGGRDLFDQPKLRVIFAPNVRDHLGNHKYKHPQGGILECWVLERLMPPDFFGEIDDWERDRYFYDDVHQVMVDRKGAFPRRGDYVMICPLTHGGEIIPLTESTYQSILRKIRLDEQFAAMNMNQRAEFVHAQDDIVEAEKKYASTENEAIRDDYYKTNWGRINRKSGAGYNITPR